MSPSLLVLRKPTGTIQLSDPFGLGERKLLNTLMYHAQTSGRPLTEEHEISVAEVQEALGWTRSKNVEKLKEYVRALLRTVIEWNEFREDRSTDWVACQFLSSGTVRGKNLRYLINPKIVAELRNPVLYAKVQLLVQGRLHKRHSLVLYEYFQDALGRKLPVDAVPIDFLVSLLGLSGETYRQFKYFRRDVLAPSLAEINAYTDLEVSYTTVREGRQTVALDFVVRRDEAFQLAFDLPAVEALGDGRVDGVAALVRHGVARAAAQKLCERHSGARVADHVTLLEGQLAAGATIANPGAWLRRAIEGNWAMQAEPIAIGDATGKRVGSAPARDGPPTTSDDAADFQSFRIARAREVLRSRTKTFRTRRWNAFVEAMQHEQNTTVLDTIRRHGPDHAMVTACYITHGTLMDDLLVEAHERDLDAWRAWRASQGAGEVETPA